MMRQRLIKALCRYGAQLCAVAAVAAPVASQVCTYKFYQPAEPDGLAEFAKRGK